VAGLKEDARLYPFHGRFPDTSLVNLGEAHGRRYIPHCHCAGPEIETPHSGTHEPEGRR
jgi:hypothetical protein